MPSVPVYQQTETLRPNFRQGIDVQASPDDFGAAVGRGLSNVGQGVADAADAMRQVNSLEAETVVRAGRNGYMREKDSIQYDPETGYLQKQGKDAIDGFPEYARQLGELRQKYSSKMTPEQQQLFARAVEPLEVDARRAGMIHKGEALKKFVVEEASSGADNFKNEAIKSYNDPVSWGKYTTAGLVEIQGLGEKLGWSAEKLKQEQTDYLSDAHRLTALQIAEQDPVAATEYAVKHRDSMTAPDHLTLMRELLPRLGEATTRDAVSVSASRPGAREFAAAGLPREAYSLLGVIAGTESPGYNVINGGARFSGYADHPRVKGAGGSSTAAGRYQFVKGTWDRVASALGLPDFSPVSQDVAAWWLARADYKSRTGRDLQSDIRAGNFSQVRAGLAGTWEGIAKLSDAQFAQRVQSVTGNVTTGSADDGGVQFSPRVETLLSGLPADYASRIREAAGTGLSQFQTQENAQIKAHRLSVADDYKLRIANDDTALTKQEILDDPVLDNGDKATLVSALTSKQGEALKTQEAVTAFQAGKLAIDPYDGDGRKLVDGVWNTIATTVDPAKIRPAMEDLVRQSGIVPAPVANALRTDLSSGNIKNVAAAAQLAVSLRAIDPAAFERRDGGKEISDAAVTFSHLTGDIGMTGDAAAQRMVDMRDPTKVRERSALMESKPIKDFIKGQAVEAEVRDIFDPGLFGTDPKLGETVAQSAAMVGEYRDMLEESTFDAGGDQELAKKLAADRFKRRYGVSDFSISGPKVVTRLPPEVAYPVGKDGTHDYIRQQAVEALATEGIKASEVYLQADDGTVRDFNAGKPPRYEVWYRDDDGVLERYHLPFYAVASSTAENFRDAKAKAERKRDENRDRLAAGRDREGTLDRFLDGNPLTGGQ